MKSHASTVTPTTPRPRLARRALAATLAFALGIPMQAPAFASGAHVHAGSDARSGAVASAMSGKPGAPSRSPDIARFSPTGQSIPVTTCADDGAGSLRAAVAAAASGDTLDASGLACSTISLSTGIVIGVADLAIVGPGPQALNVGNGAKYGRVLTHTGSGSLELRGLTISSGVVSPMSNEADSRGGCIFSAGSVSLGNLFDPTSAVEGVVVRDCTAVSTQAGVNAEGGGVFATAGLSMASSVVSGCRAVAQDDATRSVGGGVSTHRGTFNMKYSEIRDSAATGPLGVGGGASAAFLDDIYISHSTIAGNDATARAGGAYLATNSGRVLTIDNTTVSGNTSNNGEAGLVVGVLSGATPGSIRIASSTITENISLASDGGIFMSGSARIDSSIFAGNSGGADLHTSSPVSGSDILVGHYSATLPPEGLIVTTDPRLAPLAGNGGPTRTHALLTDSPAVDVGNNTFNATSDQRGYARSLGMAPDIGAYERNPDALFSSGFE